MTIHKPPFRPLLAAGIAVAASWTAAAAVSAAPQAVTITTQVTFNPTISGTFQATGPICPSGVVVYVDEKDAAAGAAFNVNGLTQFVCDDNSGTFTLRLHPQAAARPDTGFALSGPWSVWGKGTGAYATMSGHGDFGVNFVPNSNPVAGEETYIGFVTF